MILHKIFHVNQSPEQAKERLGDINAYLHHLKGVQQVDFTGHGLSHWRLRLPLGIRVKLVLSEVEAENGNVAVFKSLDGNVHVFGMATFHEIRPNLTEVDFMVDYKFDSRIVGWIDRWLRLGDQFVINQLRSVRAHFEGIAQPAPHTFEFLGSGLKTATT